MGFESGPIKGQVSFLRHQIMIQELDRIAPTREGGSDTAARTSR